MLPGDEALSTPLHAVTFCVVDLETTGGSPASSTITEVGAATFRGGERLGTFQTLVNPGSPVPPDISQITGITDAMLRPAPSISQVLPSLVEFAHGAVLVGHNLRFDTSFLDAALAATGRSLLDQLRVDTVALARRLVRDDVPDCKLGTLALHLGLPHQPTHRALDDVLATADLLHLLLERAAAYGVTALDDLLALPDLASHPHAGKLRLTVRLPRSPGAYLVRNRRGEPLHAGHADDVRTRVRSYFSASPDVPGDRRRSVSPVLREAHTVDHLRCGSGLEAAVAAARLARVLAPRHDVRATSAAAQRYVTATAGGRLSVTRRPRAGAACVVGPVASTAVARQVIAAIEAATSPDHTGPATPSPAPAPPDAVEPSTSADGRLGGPLDDASTQRHLDALMGTAPAQGRLDGFAPDPGAASFASDAATPAEPRVEVAVLVDRPGDLVARLVDRGDASVAAGRFAAAALARQHAAVLADAVARQRDVERWRLAGRVVVGLPDGGRAELVRGCLVRTWHPDRSSVVWAQDDGGTPVPVPVAPGGRPPAPASLGDVRLDGVAPPPADGPVPVEASAELACVAAWLDDHAADVRLLHVEGRLSSPLPPLPAVPAPEAGDEPAAPGVTVDIDHELGPLARERNPAELVPYLRQLVEARATAVA